MPHRLAAMFFHLNYLHQKNRITIQKREGVIICYKTGSDLLQAVGEEEVLDYENVDEDKLLASQAHSNSMDSPCRSPRLRKSSPHTPERKAWVQSSSPTRSVLETAPTNTEAMPMAVETMVATCSPTKDLTSVAQDTSVVGDCSSTLEVSAHSAL
ncbi:hypothetical protein DPMN_132851 [Dreissena polymorpha]|uniref:Uncharacterized protein n=1 Tax=Dreissena polymorpha TaxID=45954 RepID=A0A9D4FSE7_DREPO|nr:hypothetical protein DPMN_132851 [Dreissena polymorpha]